MAWFVTPHEDERTDRPRGTISALTIGNHNKEHASMKTKTIIVALILAACSLALCFSATAADTPLLTLQGDKRPEWLRRDGIVMAGSWEPLLFRVRRDGAQCSRRAGGKSDALHVAEDSGALTSPRLTLIFINKSKNSVWLILQYFA
ncbi:MAG: hypothetical protein WA117_13505 [Verrucomicrobiia bacterium]